MKIAFFEVEEWQIPIIGEELQEHDVIFFDSPLNDENYKSLEEDVNIISTFIYSSVTKKVIDYLPELKMIATRSTGFDHIDIEHCKKKNITVSNVPIYGENTVAEHTFSLILGLSRKIYPSLLRTKINNSFKNDDTLRGFDLKGKTLGLVGCGSIGKHVARIAIGFEMNVIVFDLKKNYKLAKEIGFKYAKLDEIFAESDFISLHVPLNKHTEHMISDESISKMKKGVVIINTSRGGVIDTSALFRALKQGRIGGAGLDVLEGEHTVIDEIEVLEKEFDDTKELKNMLENHAMMNMENVLVTPHNAFNSWEAVERILNTTIDNIKSINDKKIKNKIN